MEPKIVHVFQSCIHVAVTHPNSLLESKDVSSALRSAGRDWCKRNGQKFRSGWVSGWTLGPEESETRMICLIGEVE